MLLLLYYCYYYFILLRIKNSLYSLFFPIKIIGTPLAWSPPEPLTWPGSTQDTCLGLRVLPPGKPASRTSCQNPIQVQCPLFYEPSLTFLKFQLSLLSGILRIQFGFFICFFFFFHSALFIGKLVAIWPCLYINQEQGWPSSDYIPWVTYHHVLNTAVTQKILRIIQGNGE